MMLPQIEAIEKPCPKSYSSGKKMVSQALEPSSGAPTIRIMLYSGLYSDSPPASGNLKPEARKTLRTAMMIVPLKQIDYNMIIYPIFYLLKGDYSRNGVRQHNIGGPVKS